MVCLKPTRGRLIAVTIVLIGGGFFAWLWYLAALKRDIYFLQHRPPAEWILYAKPPSGSAHPSAELSTVFRRTVVLNGSTGSALLSVRAMKRWSLSLNGAELEPATTPAANWKTATTINVAGKLHPGTNELAVTVFNSNGPPALWLVLETNEGTVASGPDWEASLLGASWCKVRLASQPPEVAKGNPLYGGEHPVLSLVRRLPVMLGLLVFSAGLLVAMNRLGRVYREKGEPWGSIHSTRFAALVIGIAALFWCVLFNNLGILPSVMGFDARFHLQYIDYIKTHWRLPLANEGWQMYQPPFYYVISALLSAPFSSKGFSLDSLAVLRGFGLLVGIAHFTLVFLSLRLLFPGRVGLQLLGLVLAAFLPENLYLAHYVSNEALSGTLITASVYFCLRILKSEKESPLLFAGMAVCLGASLLTKVTGLIAVPFIGIALLSRIFGNGPAERRIRAGTVVWAGLLTLAICGWHYLRVWRRLGSPLVGNWDWFHWWMEDGFHTGSYFLHFGAVLSSPWHCGFSGFFDGLYSTLWGDGLWGGMVSLADRPPWNYELMAAGFLLALVPTALILLGSLGALRRFIRQPDPAWFLLIGLGSATLAAILYMGLRLPYCGQVKAFYGLIAMLPLCAFGVLGWDLLLRWSKVAGWAAAILFGAWAMNSYASFRICRADSDVQVSVGHGLVYDHQEQEADQHFAEALRLDPKNPNARTHMAARLALHEHPDEAIQMLESVLKEAPDDVEGHYLLSLVLEGQQKLDAAIAQAQLACRLAPDHPGAHLMVCQLLVKAGRYEDALAAGREGLRADALDPDMYFCMGSVYSHLGQQTNALMQFGVAAGLNPIWPEVHEQLAITRQALHQEKEASAEYARAAVAFAKAGRFEEAVLAAQKARDAALACGDKDLANKDDELIEQFLKRQTYTE